MSYTVDWTTDTVKSWEPLNKFKGVQSNALEIGVYEGRTAIWLLENILTHPNSFLYGIDPYKYKERHELGDQELAAAYDRMLLNMQPYFNKFLLLDEWSEMGIARLMLDFDVMFDIIRVDGSHKAFDTLSDMSMSWHLLKPGGIMIVDDYDDKAVVAQKEKWNEDCPKTAVDAFLKTVKAKVLWMAYDIGFEKV